MTVLEFLRARLGVLLLLLVVGVSGYILPGCYVDWAFLHAARLQSETQAREQQLKALQDENARLKAAAGQADKK